MPTLATPPPPSPAAATKPALPPALPPALTPAPTPAPPATAQPAVPPGVIALPGGRVLLSNISWATYMALGAEVGRGTRLTYDNGWLEIEMVGPVPEKIKKFTAAMIERLLVCQRVTFEPSGRMTWQRSDLRRGLEADDCYHVQTASLVVGRDVLDLTVDPPPDLAIEVEVTSPLLNKVAVYAGLGVPELWRVRADGACDKLRLDAAGAYQPVDASVAVPPFTPAVVSQYLRLRAELSHSAALARFEAEFLPTVAAQARP